MSEHLSAFPLNSAILVFEQDSPEFKRVSRVGDVLGVLNDTVDDLRKVAKYGIASSSHFDFRDLIAHGISAETIQSVAYAIREGIYKNLGERSLDLDTL